MNNAWIVGLKKATAYVGGPLSPEDWNAAVGGVETPAVLKAVYTTFDGAQFHNGVALWKLRDAIVKSHDVPPGLPKTSTLLFGESASGHPLFTVRKNALPAALRASDEVADVDAEAWVFGVRRGAKDIRLAPSLEALLTRLVPPAQTEDFGEVTYVHAVSAVHDALRSLQENTDAQAKTVVLGKSPAKAPAPKSPTKRAKKKK